MRVLLAVFVAALIAGVLAWMACDPASTAGQASGARALSSEAAGAQPAGDLDTTAFGERIRVGGDAPLRWLLCLLYGPSGGAAGYSEIVSALREGTAQHQTSLIALLGELETDNRNEGRLKNVELPLALLLSVDAPTKDILAARDSYLTNEPATRRHSQLMSGVRDWPVDEATRAKIRELLGKLKAATTHAARVAAIEQLLGLGRVGAKSIAVEIVRLCHEDGGGTVPLVHALLDTSAEPSVLTLLLHEAASTQLIAGQERASAVVNMIGIGFRTYLAGELGSRIDNRRRMAIQSVLMEMATEGAVEQVLGLGVTTAVALGGGKQDDPRVASFLANASKQWPALAANTALVNLGYSTDPTSFLAYVPWPLTPPRDAQRMIRHADYIAGLSVALNRHPDQESVVLPYVIQTLRTWRSSRYEVLVCEDVMRLVASMNMRGASPALRDLRDANVPRLSKLAGEILAGWQ